jgi:hypothetical protein
LQISEAIRRDPKLLGDVERATAILEEVMTHSAKDISVIWKSMSSLDEIMLGLDLTDGTSIASAAFTEADLSPDSRKRLRRALNWLWGDLLQEQSHRLMEKLNLTMQELGKD